MPGFFTSGIHALHAFLRVARALHLNALVESIQQRHVLRLQHHLRRLRIFDQVADLFRTGDRHQLRVLRQQPGERYLARRAAVLLRQRLYRV